MPVQQSSASLGSKLSKTLTFFPHRPVEEGRNRGVLTLSLIGTGTSGVTTLTNLATTCERGILSSGLVLSLTASGGVVTAATVSTAGSGYYIGQRVRAVGTTATGVVEFRVDDVSATGGVNILSILQNGTASATTQSSIATTADGGSGPNGLLVNITGAGGIATAISTVTGREGRNYRIGDIITVTGSGGSTPVTASVTALQF
jgi:hypothetical protein